MDGSSPRVRGTRQDGRPQQCPNRFIPACAGNTRAGSHRGCRQSVHPRVCGEHFVRVSSTLLPVGSSPRVRGTRPMGGDEGRRRRFIPACAGNTRATRPTVVRQTVHPRVCGEHGRPQTAPLRHAGSSPRVRGTLDVATDCRSDPRFIPACAGNTPNAITRFTLATVHPRVCGEHGRQWQAHDGKAGSSPRVRGTRKDGRAGCLAGRFIPACAGNTSGTPPASRSSTVHPRVCGEHDEARVTAMRHAGSSPRVRGTPECAGCRYQAHRFIPACAGNTRLRHRPGLPRPVHPRVCGEHDVVAGLSLGVERFIPACAGNTFVGAGIPSESAVHPRVCGEHAIGRQVTGLPTGSSPRVRGTRHQTTTRR